MDASSQVQLPESYRCYQEMVDEYVDWLVTLGQASKVRHLGGEASSKDRGQVEGVIGEAGAWAWLGRHAAEVDLYKPETETSDPGTCRAPDFLINQSERPALVEVGAMFSDGVVNRTGLERHCTPGAKHYQTLTTSICRVVKKKAPQLGSTTHPALVIATCINFEAAMVAMATCHLDELLIGRTVIQGSFDPDRGEVSGPLQERMTIEGSLFLDPSDVTGIRKNVSGVIVLNLSTHPEPLAMGVLNPCAVRPFDPEGLPAACFGSLDPWPPKQVLKTVWRTATGLPCDDDSSKQRSRAEARQRLIDQGLGDWLDELDGLTS